MSSSAPTLACLHWNALSHSSKPRSTSPRSLRPAHNRMSIKLNMCVLVLCFLCVLLRIVRVCARTGARCRTAASRSAPAPAAAAKHPSVCLLSLCFMCVLVVRVFACLCLYICLCFMCVLALEHTVAQQQVAQHQPHIASCQHTIVRCKPCAWFCVRQVVVCLFIIFLFRVFLNKQARFGAAAGAERH